MTPPKRINKRLAGLYLTVDKASGRYRFYNRMTGKRTWFGTDEAVAIEKAKKALLGIKILEEKREADGGLPSSVSGVINLFRVHQLPHQPWSDGTKKNFEFKLNKIEQMFGARPFVAMDRVIISDWLATFCDNGDTFNKWRWVFVLLYRYAIERKLCDYNEAEAVQARSTSDKIEANQKSRIPLTEKQFWWLYERAELWLKVLLRAALITLQGRSECLRFKYEDIRNGYWYIIRQKTSRDSDCAFIKIEMNPQLEELVEMSREDNVITQYVVHRQPRRTRASKSGDPEYFKVNPEYASKAMGKLVDQAIAEGVIRVQDGETRPTLHEIRGLGSRMYRAQGWSEEQIQELMEHSDPKTTTIYLNGGAEALEDRHYRPVKAGLQLVR